MKQPVKSAYRRYIGIDVAKASSVVAVVPSNGFAIEAFKITNDRDGFTHLRQTLESDGTVPSDTLAVLEPTGTYYLPIATFLVRAGYDVTVINALTARRHIRAMLDQDKTDNIDAMRLAEIGILVRNKLVLWEEPPQVYEELRQRLELRDALVDVRAKQLTRQHAVQPRLHLAAVDRQREAVIAYVDKQVKALEQEMNAILLADPAWGQNARYLLSIPGLGVYTVTAMTVHTLNFTTVDSAEQLASFVGVVPRKHQSGQTSYVHIRFSSVPRLRSALYMCMMSAVRFNPVIRDFYTRLVGRGVGRQKTRIACIRKMLHIAWGCVHNQAVFDPEYAARTF